MADKDLTDLTNVHTFLTAGAGRWAVLVITVGLVVAAVFGLFS